jgi:Arc/MetJ-type ribon-helix-helix transcriptional regulator
MIRTQVQLTDRQLEHLRELSASTGRSISDLIREGVDKVVAGKGGISREERVKRGLAVAGRFASGRSDVSSHHDDHLAEAFSE